jgi:chemotaxis protein MotB
MAGHGGRQIGHAAEHENDERWLLTYADMITLLMALFMVLFSISSVNISKYRTLQLSLKAAFSGNILPGGRAIMHPGSTSSSSTAPTSRDVQTLVPLTPRLTTPQSTQQQGTGGQSSQQQHQMQVFNQQQAAAAQEQSNFKQVQALITAYAKQHGFGAQVTTSIQSRGLVVQILTDHVLFKSGSAQVENRGDPLLIEIAHLLNAVPNHPLVVEGFTDDVPINTAQFPSNWSLSAERATNVVLFMIAHGVSAQRLGAAGYAQLHPVASNATAAGRARNRRVQIVLQRVYNVQPGS